MYCTKKQIQTNSGLVLLKHIQYFLYQEFQIEFNITKKKKKKKSQLGK